MMYSPLEQFSVLNFFSLYSLDFTNLTIYCFLTVYVVKVIWDSLYQSGGFLVPNNYQIVTEELYNFVESLVKEQLGPKNSKLYVTIVFTTFLYVLTANLLGLIPFSFATTAQLIVAFGLSFGLFIGVTFIGLVTHGYHFLNFFLPSGAPIQLAPLLVTIELISYVFRPISLGVRLFANITSGHSLLVIIAGFGWTMACCLNLGSILGSIPVLVLVVIFGLELAVSFLQAYVFSVLLCIYLKDAIELH